jgi:hypothetical protein
VIASPTNVDSKEELHINDYEWKHGTKKAEPFDPAFVL